MSGESWLADFLLALYRADIEEEAEAGEFLAEVEKAVVYPIAALLDYVYEAEACATILIDVAVGDLLTVGCGKLSLVHDVYGVELCFDVVALLGTYEVARHDAIRLAGVADDDDALAGVIGVARGCVGVAADVLQGLHHDVEDLALDGTALGMAEEALLCHDSEVSRHGRCNLAHVDQVYLFCREVME